MNVFRIVFGSARRQLDSKLKQMQTMPENL